MTEPLDIYGKAELIHALGVSRQRVAELQETDKERFPKPAEIKDHPDGLACGPIWHGEQVREYARARRTRATAGRGT